MFSFSFYFSEPLEQIEKKFQQASAYGCTELFTSLHIPEDDLDKYHQKLPRIGELAKRCGVGVVADVTPSSLTKLGISGERLSALRGWGISGLRLDDGFSMKEAAHYSHQIKVVLNASTLTERECDELVACSANWGRIEAWHNFYPRPETGLSKETVIQKNQILRRKGIRTIAAFIPGNKEKRGPLHQGLPTLEAHRHMDPLCAYAELVRDCDVDKVFIGDFSMTDDALMRIKEFQDGIIPLRYRPLAIYDWLALVETVHTNRRDAARDVIRSTESRLSLAWPDDALRPAYMIPREKGSVTIDNNQYGRYAGELQITLTDLPANEKVNVVGRIMEDDLPLLAYVGGGQCFRLMRTT
ncbi:DUF871 domain-containing protein [Saccharococcus caldoxylosilyticus]|uniref:DUF871 domain-containing protein n=1 Tax=Parageobacillus caldoxylosilyticus NBRC 107762 TaxID=1220594 RepID=A0A023DJV8_9BACL|nr:MupG family TIM beta-alpha barrel fold protein [Parageobacillus caldoxylosilyticus]MBB3853356.1 hypothetical protein [Parageobacillus caldoxylosilyticus]GAJ41560.1 hypothetical protein GCA01S_076_00020 [Parageobacillus caldoxylosilyticus NBRC 107762]